MNIRIEVVGTPPGTGDRAAGAGDGNPGHEFEREQDSAGERAGFVIAQQTNEYLQQQRACPDCGRRLTSKDSGSTPMEDGVRPSKGGESTVEPLSLSGQWSQDISSRESLASGTGYSRNDVPGDEVGVFGSRSPKWRIYCRRYCPWRIL
jgi:hypothetical protein